MFAVGTTDLRWHEKFLNEPFEGLINFWTPTPWSVRLPTGIRWFFMLKSPVRKIGGFGTFVGYREGTVSEAWARYGSGNGVTSSEELDARVRAYAEKRSVEPVISDPRIGFIELADCVFLPAELQMSAEELGISFAKEIVKFKRFEGELLLPFEDEFPTPDTEFSLVPPSDAQRALVEMKKRVGQSLFRRQVLAAYGGSCAFTGTTLSHVLDAAHIQPFVSLASNHVQNGITLRKDVHALFDAGLIAVGGDYRIIVAPPLRGSVYEALEGVVMRLPKHLADNPSPAALKLHREDVFDPARNAGTGAAT